MGHHGCCCECVVDELLAMPAPEEERTEAARNRFLDCPHREITPLEYFVLTARAGMRAGGLTGEVSSKGGDERVAPGVEAVASRAPQPLETEDLTVATDARELRRWAREVGA